MVVGGGMIQVLLVIAGVGLSVLALAHAVFPRRLGWTSDMDHVSLLTRQVFFVHVFFIAVTLALMAAISFAAAWTWPLSGALARVVFWGFSLFWGARLVFQFFVYSPAHWKGNRFRTVMHIVFSITWLLLTIVYGVAAYLVA
jgi:hypothetical protein